MNTIERIQNWYIGNCDGAWEHSFGVRIDTLDNPGWIVRIDLEGTELEGKCFQSISSDVSDDNWISCKVVEKRFEGAGDTLKLGSILNLFLDWAENGPG